MTPEKIAFKKARETYRAHLIEVIETLLEKHANDSEIILISSSSTCGIATGDYTDVISSIDGTGMGMVYNNTDLDTLAFEEKQKATDILNIQGLEELLQSIYNKVIFQQ